MASFDTSREKISVLGGRLISVEKAERLIKSLESAVETAHEYEEWEELHDVGLNDRALDHLLSPTDKEYILEIGVSFEMEGEKADLATEYFVELHNHNSKYSNIDATIMASDIRPFFEESEGITGMSIEIP